MHLRWAGSCRPIGRPKKSRIHTRSWTIRREIQGNRENRGNSGNRGNREIGGHDTYSPFGALSFLHGPAGSCFNSGASGGRPRSLSTMRVPPVPRPPWRRAGDDSKHAHRRFPRSIAGFCLISRFCSISIDKFAPSFRHQLCAYSSWPALTRVTRAPAVVPASLLEDPQRSEVTE